MKTKEDFLNSLPPEERKTFEEQRKHQFTILTLDGTKLIFDPKYSANLFEEILRGDRYIVDTNSNWKGIAARPENRDKVFIIGKNVVDEQRDHKGLFFGPKTDISNNNIFIFGLSNEYPELAVGIERLDANFRRTLDKMGMAARLQSQNEEMDAYLKELDRQHMVQVENEKAAILLLLGVQKIQDLELTKKLTERISIFRSVIREHLPKCFFQWGISCHVARHCYALQLAVKRRMRTQFAKSGDPNLFGDSLVLHNALFLRAKIISNDDLLGWMAKEAGIECVRDTDMMGNGRT